LPNGGSHQVARKACQAARKAHWLSRCLWARPVFPRRPSRCQGGCWGKLRGRDPAGPRGWRQRAARAWDGDV